MLNRDTKKILSTALIQGHVDYASTSWYYSLGSTLKNKLQVVQNKMARFILTKGPRDHIGYSELKSIGFLSSQDRVTQLSMNMVHSIFYGKCPEYMKTFFTKIRDVHSYNNRGSSYNFHVPKINTITAKTFYYNAITLWNSLPDNVKSLQNKDSFKKSLKSHLFSQGLLRETATVVTY